jgi:predicted dehydrogenase/threonine dehydrogenase-like Zn-dependent dehydrogenase
MRQVLIHRGQILVEHVPAPLVEEGHVLVEVAYSLISAGTEMSNVETSAKSLIKQAMERPDKVTQLLDHLRRHGIQKTIAKVQGQLGYGNPTGYSCAGIVIQAGQGITDIRPGNPVACAGAGIANHAEIVLVPRNLVVKVPEGCELRAAASVTLGAIAMQAVRRADPRLGEIVAVIGLGLLGQLTMQLLNAAGCQVIGFDLEQRRVALAQQLGAGNFFVSSDVDVLNEVHYRTAGHGVDATIITATSSSDAIVQQAMGITRKKGRVVVVGAVGLGLQRSPFYEKEIDLLISCSYGPGRYDETYERQGLDYPYAYIRWTENRNMAEYLRLVAAGRVQVKPLLEQEYDVAHAPQAYHDLQNGAIKPLGVLLRYPPNGQQRQEATLPARVPLCSRLVCDKINVAVVGAGAFAKGVHLPNLRRLSNLYHIRAIVSATGSNTKATAQQFGADYFSTDYLDVLNDSDVDAVLLCTRHHLHAQQTIDALKAGKHVYCEKPLALTQQELDAILACYGTAQIAPATLQPVLMVGYNRRFSPAARQIKATLATGHNPLMMLYRFNAGILPPHHWVHGPQGGGRIIGEMCHMFDLSDFFVESPPVSMDVQTLPSWPEYVQTNDNLCAILSYSDGSISNLFYSSLGASEIAKEYIEVYVDGKTLVLDDFRHLRIYGARRDNWNSVIEDRGHKQALEAFAHALKSGRHWPISLNSLLTSARMSIVASESCSITA